MSAIGTKRTCRLLFGMSAFGGKAAWHGLVVMSAYDARLGTRRGYSKTTNLLDGRLIAARHGHAAGKLREHSDDSSVVSITREQTLNPKRTLETPSITT